MVVWSDPSSKRGLHQVLSSSMDDTASNTRQKALALNLDATTYGTFAEIGAGQEVARWFFSVGGAFHRRNPVEDLVAALMDGLSRDQVEIDMIKLSGPAFAGVDNRLMSLQLVERGLTDAAMFTADGQVVQPSEILYKQPILVERGSFRPATNLTLDMLDRAREQFLEEPGVAGQNPIVLAETT